MPPSNPRNLHVVSTDKGEICLAWQAPKEKAKAPIDGYIIETLIGDSIDFMEIGRVEANALSFDATGLNIGQKYNFRIKAHNSEGASDGVQLEKAVAACPPIVGKPATSVNF